MTKLKPCPFCGNPNPVYWNYTEEYFTERWAVLCYYPDGGCGAEGSRQKSKEEAAAAWNERKGEIELNIKEAVRILEENRPSVIWGDEEMQKRAARLNKAIDTVMLQMKPAEIEMDGGGSNWYCVCGECHGVIDESDLYCKHCGRPVEKT